MTEYKILYVTADSSPQSGAFKNLLYMIREIEKWDYRSVLVLHEDGRDSPLLTAKENEQTYFMPLPRARRGQTIGYYLNFCLQNIQSIYRLVHIIRREQVAVVHVNDILDVYAAVAARIAGVPCIWYVRAGLASAPALRPLLSRITALLASAIVVVSESVREHMFWQQGVEPKNISIIYDIPDLDEFQPDIDGIPIRQEFNLDDKKFLVVLVAKLFESKGHEPLIRSVPQVLASYPHTQFMIVGGALPGPHHSEYETRLKALPGELGVQENVIFTGFRTDIPQIMAAADIVTHCATYPDPCPGVVLQGMSMGKTVIAPDLGGPREQIENHVSGLLVEPANPAALAEAICSLLGDEDRRVSLGQAAVNRVRSTFTPKSNFQKLADLYDSLIIERCDRKSREEISADSSGEVV